MAPPIAVVDTSVLVLLLSTPGPNESEAVRIRRERSEVTLAELRKQGAVFVVPTPVVAELGRYGKGSEVLRKKLVRQLKRSKVQALNVDAADIAGQMSDKALAARTEGEERGAVKYDALIAAVAHDIGARWLVTDNRKDMQRCLDAVQSPVELIVTSAIPKKGQLHLVHAQPATPDGDAAKPRAAKPKAKADSVPPTSS
jgi:predicted nucleic acid-binding protein